MLFLFKAVFDHACKQSLNKWLALFAIAWYGLHTANAETINYICARSDSLSTMFVVMALVFYIYSKTAQKYWLYLLPFILGVLVKPAALIFAPLLFCYIYLIEEKSLYAALIKSSPAFIVSILLYWLQHVMTPPTFYPSNIPLFNYIITQPFVALYYFKLFFLPIGLSADYDWQALANVYDPRLAIGLVFVFSLLGLAYWLKDKKIAKPVVFGILWFFLALLPSSSIIAFAEVLNDHRIFFPYVGLVLVVVWPIGWGLVKYRQEIKNSLFLKILLILLGLSILLANAVGVRHRNAVWRTGETLWHDVTIKSPKNGRGLMNYGLTQMEQAKYDVALKYFNQALIYNPRYGHLYINLGILHGAMGHSKLAEDNFKQAIIFAPNYYGSYYYYARWLHGQNRNSEALLNVQKAIKLSPAYMPAMQLLRQLAASKTSQDYLNMSLAYYNQGQYYKSIKAAQQAIKIKPNYAEAYNNIGAAYNQLQQWDRAIEALQTAIKLKPGYQLAINNLQWAKNKGK